MVVFVFMQRNCEIATEQPTTDTNKFPTDSPSVSRPSQRIVCWFRAPRGPRDGGRGDRICARTGVLHNTAVGLGLS